MKLVIKLALCILCIVFLGQCKKETDFNVHITDINFLNALIDLGVDENADSIISLNEAERITSLYISDVNISDLSGIEAFVNLDTLYCKFTKLTRLDLSNNRALKLLECGSNKLTSLNVLNNNALVWLDCSENELSGINVSKNISLKCFYCYANQLSGLDVSKNTALIWFSCANNYLTRLDMSKNTALRLFSCDNNNVSNLNVSNNTALTALCCSSNQLTDLDISKNISLERIEIEEMPSLTKVCVWQVPFPPAGVEIFTENSPNVYFTKECSK